MADPPGFGVFLQRRAAFVSQKTVLDYCRVKAGRREATTFADPDFQAALLHCRWQVYLATLSDMAALAEAWLRPAVPPGSEAALAKGLLQLHAAALTAEPLPVQEQETAAAMAAALPGHLAGLQQAPPRPANRLPLLAEAPLFATLPVHPDQRIGESPSIRGALRFHLVSTQQEMERRFDGVALAANILSKS